MNESISAPQKKHNEGLTIKRLLFILLFGLLWLPIIQGTLHPFFIRHLDGAITNAPDTDFTFHGWFTGKFQIAKEKFVNDTFGLRNVIMRNHNEINYTLFKMASAKDVIVGKENYLYEKNYIKSFYGQDFIGVDSIAHRMERLKFIQDTLAKLNKTLLVVFAASKGSFYPEYFPDNMRYEKGTTNYQIHLKFAKALGINFIDFDEYFIDNKLKSKYPLFSRHGIHWSTYGECIVADSIIKYVENRRKIRMQHIYWKKIDRHCPEPENVDIDIENGMNLLFPLNEDTLAYPEIQFEKDSGKAKPSLIVISDSYYWGMFNFGFGNLFSDNKFWYYNAEVYPDSYEKTLYTGDIDLNEQIANHDVFILMTSEPNLKNFGWGFIENAYAIFKHGAAKSGGDNIYMEKIKKMITNIKNDGAWLEKVKNGATASGISLDSALKSNAIYMIEHPNK